MKPTESWRIEPAEPRHLREIAHLAETNKLKVMPPDVAPELGFLVSEFRESDYRHFLTHAEYFYVLLDNEAVVGFLLAYSRQHIPPDDLLGSLLKDRYSEPFVVIKQICIAAGSISRGLATGLYEHLLSQAPDCPLFAAVVLDPPNVRSINFHEKMGFEKVLEVKPRDGMLRGVWRREPLAGPERWRRSAKSGRSETGQLREY